MKNLRSLLITSEEKRNNSVFSLEDKPSYPSGLKLKLDSETIKKLGIEEMPKVGSYMHIMARAEVVEVGKEEGRGDMHSFEVELQIVQADIHPESPDMQMSNMLYNGGEY